MASKENSLSEIVRGLEELFPQMSKPHILKMAMGSLADESESSSEGDRDESMAAGDDPYEHEDAEEMAQRHQDEMKHCTSDEARAEMERRHELERERFAKRIRGLEVESRQSVSGKPLSIEQFQAAVARHPMVVQMASELNQLRAAQARKAAEAAVDSAIRGGRLVPSQRDWAVEYCSSEPRGFHKFIGAQPQILQSGPDGTFTGRIGEAPADALTRKELAVCETLGIGADQFAVAKKVRLSHNVHLGD